MNRINTVIDCLPKDIEHLYDLFCDHGKLGLGYNQLFPDTQVTFIDNKKHIIESLKKNNKNKKFRFLCEDARLSKFEKQSTITMCGTGAYLVIDCLKRYFESSYFPSLNFFFAVNMHHFELRNFLIENEIKCKCIKIINDGKYCYELIKTIGNKQHLKIFDESEWDLSNPIQRLHLSSKLKTYQNKKDLLPWEKHIKSQLYHFLS